MIKLVSFLSCSQNYLGRNRKWLLSVILFLTLILSFSWIWVQEMHFKDLTLNPEEAETLIGWELNRQLRILVIVLTSAIAVITITNKPKISGSTFFASTLLAIVNILSLSRFIQGLQFVIHYEQKLYPNIKAQIYSKWEVIYSNFFLESGKLNVLGWIFVIFALITVMLTWVFLLRSVEINSKEDNLNKNK